MGSDQHSRLAPAVFATLAAAAICSMIAPRAQAVERNWNNAQPTAGWNAPGNWSPSGVPVAGDNVNLLNWTTQFQTVTYDIPVGTSPLLGRLTLNAEFT